MLKPITDNEKRLIVQNIIAGDPDYAYYKSKTDTYNAICDYLGV